MTLYTKASLESLRQRIDLIEVLSSHIELKRAGAAYKALCPFHDEKSPSFVVQRGDRHYHCFGCGAHGDAIQFLMQFDSQTFAEAVESLAQKFGVHLERAEGEREHQGPSKAKLREAMADARTFYHALLLHTAEGQEALRYLFDRGIDLDFVRQFHLGYAPNRGGVFQQFMKERGHSIDILRAAGLLSESQGRLRDFFRDRIAVPVCDPTGAVIAFSARKFKEDTFGGKYVNTPETPLFKKSRVLFGLHYSRRRIAKEHRVIIVEGQLDALRLIKEGFNLTVAGQGTAFGEEHVQELTRLGVREVFLALDADHAGQEAAVKIGDLFQARGVDVKVATMPMGSDPDTFLMERGPEAFKQLLQESGDYLNFLVQHLSQDMPLNTPAGKSQLVQAITRQVRQWENSLMVHETLRKLARILDVPEDIMGLGQPAAPSFHIRKNDTLGVLKNDVDPDRILETDLLRWMLLVGESQPELIELVQMNLNDNDLRVPACRGLFVAYLAAVDEGGDRDLLGLAIRSGDGDAQNLIGEVLGKKVNEERAESELSTTIERILERNWMRRCESIKDQLNKDDLDDDKALDLVKEFETVRKARPVLLRPSVVDTEG